MARQRGSVNLKKCLLSACCYFPSRNIPIPKFRDCRYTFTFTFCVNKAEALSPSTCRETSLVSLPHSVDVRDSWLYTNCQSTLNCTHLSPFFMLLWRISDVFSIDSSALPYAEDFIREQAFVSLKTGKLIVTMVLNFSLFYNCKQFSCFLFVTKTIESDLPLRSVMHL